MSQGTCFGAAPNVPWQDFETNLGSFKSWTLLQHLTLLVQLENFAAPGDRGTTCFGAEGPFLELARGLGLVEKLLQKQAHNLCAED